MDMKTLSLDGFLLKPLTVTDTYLPIDPSSAADIISALDTPGSYAYLSISDAGRYEVVKIEESGGQLVITRGAAGTTATGHSPGACVKSASPLMVEVIKDLICNYDCCEDKDCKCETVQFIGESIPEGKVNVPWSGAVIFSGDLPMNIVTSNAPDWMEVTTYGTTCVLSGTPTGAQTYQMSVAAANCNGTSLATHPVTITVTGQD